ncbi:XRE family transcriptional regulator [Burkholderia sp. BCC0405]|uniref:XRE family transcriptional regulator n=1 Tax=Burkholderia sp. BCC0405 TaxID=2676298 RepID=UPI00158B25B5|nr:XRE family transcriptional regulator [Burkholderia sp. BCC0405]
MQSQQFQQHQAQQGIEQHAPRPAPISARFLSGDLINACASFRDAVCLAWEHRAIRGMTQRTLAEKLDVKGSHMSNMLNREAVDRHGKPRQDLPARYIAEFEREVGNRAVSQYLARMAMLTLMEEVITAQRGM